MSGTGNTTTRVNSSGDARIDGILHERAWSGSTIEYSLPVTNNEYGFGYGAGENLGHFSASTTVRNAISFLMDTNNGNAADDGFSLEGLTARNVTQITSSNAHIRVNQTTSDPYFYGTAWGYYPSSADTAGDVWMTNVSYDFSSPQPGQYAYATMMHELGHALGLEHGHEFGSFGRLPSQFDAMEYTIMTYRSYVGGGTTNYTNATDGYAQSWMISDIAALQHLYGADFSTNSGNTTYRWTPDNGQTVVNGGVAITPVSNKIFATIWDGGGEDTYDLSAYATDLMVDLAPGGHSLFSSSQAAGLGGGNFAKGNIYNAMLYRGDERSLIENAVGGSGDDDISGNQADNELSGGSGDDRLLGLSGDDTLNGNSGRDTLLGNGGADILNGGADRDTLRGGAGQDDLDGGDESDRLFGNKGSDEIDGGLGNDRINGGSGNDVMSGEGGRDFLNGGNGRDTLIGGTGKDSLTGGAQKDFFVFNAAADSVVGNLNDVITDFTTGVDKLDLTALNLDSVNLTGGFSGSGNSVILRTSGNDMRLFIDTDGDRSADMRITLEGVSSLGVNDFLI